jgi:hypothetical protein
MLLLLNLEINVHGHVGHDFLHTFARFLQDPSADAFQGPQVLFQFVIRRLRRRVPGQSQATRGQQRKNERPEQWAGHTLSRESEVVPLNIDTIGLRF